MKSMDAETIRENIGWVLTAAPVARGGEKNQSSLEVHNLAITPAYQGKVLG